MADLLLGNACALYHLSPFTNFLLQPLVGLRRCTGLGFKVQIQQLLAHGGGLQGSNDLAIQALDCSGWRARRDGQAVPRRGQQPFETLLLCCRHIGQCRGPTLTGHSQCAHCLAAQLRQHGPKNFYRHIDLPTAQRSQHSRGSVEGDHLGLNAGDQLEP